MNPRNECGCQSAAFINSLALAPPGRFSRSRILAVLLPSRASGLADLAFFHALALAGATCASRALLVGFWLLARGWGQGGAGFLDHTTSISSRSAADSRPL